MSSALQEKDLYYEDLKNTISLDRNERQKWQRIYYRIVLFTAPIIAGIVVDFVFFTSKEEFNTGSLTVIVGVVWSILNLYYTLLVWFGDKIITILHYFKEKERKQNKKKSSHFHLSRKKSINSESTIIELPSLNKALELNKNNNEIEYKERRISGSSGGSISEINLGSLDKEYLSENTENNLEKNDKDTNSMIKNFPPSPDLRPIPKTLEKQNFKKYFIDKDLGTISSVDRGGNLKKISSFFLLSHFNNSNYI